MWLVSVFVEAVFGQSLCSMAGIIHARTLQPTVTAASRGAPLSRGLYILAETKLKGTHNPVRMAIEKQITGQSPQKKAYYLSIGICDKILESVNP